MVTEADGDPCITCPWHGSTLRVTHGSVVHGPATARQPGLGARIAECGMVEVWPRT